MHKRRERVHCGFTGGASFQQIVKLVVSTVPCGGPSPSAALHDLHSSNAMNLISGCGRV